LNNKLTTKELIKKLKQFDPDSYPLYDDGTSLHYITRVESDEAIQLSSDEIDVLSNYIDLMHMESTYLCDDEDTLSFFSVAVLS
jgi:hypothetical protein